MQNLSYDNCVTHRKDEILNNNVVGIHLGLDELNNTFEDPSINTLA